MRTTHDSNKQSGSLPNAHSLTGKKASTHTAVQPFSLYNGGAFAAFPAVQLPQQQTIQLTPDPTVATHHPISGKPVITNLIDEKQEVYFYDGEYNFYYHPVTKEYLDENQKPLKVVRFNEDTAPAGIATGGQNQFRGLTFTVDASNRVTKAAGTIHRAGPETGRSSGVQSGAWEHAQSIYRSMSNSRKYFNGGHIIAHHLGGSPGTDNMVPMERDYNQSGSYKQFENKIDKQFNNLNPSLNIEIDVTYATDFDDLMTNMVTKDPGKKRDEINNDEKVKTMVMRTIGRIPKTINLVSLTTLGGASKAVANPESPMASLKTSLRKNYNIQNIVKEKFEQTKTAGYDKTVKERKPFEKGYGPHKDLNIDTDKDYHSEYQAIYGDMPTPGITSYVGGGNGLAGGVDAYIWMDPMGVYDRFGGSETNNAVDPQGTNWAYFHKAKKDNNAKKNMKKGDMIYKKGHLLNAGLHGPGADSRNLLPLTTKANGDMSLKFERHVKKSEALVNPAKGVHWQTRTSGVIRRPDDWTRDDAEGHNSAKLFDEEANMPAFIECKAWEAIRNKGALEKGSLIASAKIANKHSGDPDGVLGHTYAGDLANDRHINKNVRIGDNNVTAHDEVVPVAQNEIAYQKGYQKSSIWLLFNTSEINTRSFLNGLEDAGYDEGFALKGKPDMSSWDPKQKTIYDKSYQEGRDRLSYVQGYYNMEHSLGEDNDDRANDKFGEGQFERGRDTGKKLEETNAEFGSPEMKGYIRGLYERGKEDALDRLDSASNEEAYIDGYLNVIASLGYDDGFDCNMISDLAQTYKVYIDEYYRGQFDRGHSHGYHLIELWDNQSKDYNIGYGEGLRQRGYEDGIELDDQESDYLVYTTAFNKGRYDRGYEDGLDALPAGSFNDYYQQGWQEATHKRGFDDGYKNSDKASDGLVYGRAWNEGARQVTYDEGYNNILFTTYPIYDHIELLNIYDRGQYNCGDDDGYALRQQFRNKEAYVNGYCNGIMKRGGDDGAAARDPISDNNLYMYEFNRAIYERGRQDGLEGDMTYSNDVEYMNGFRSVRSFQFY